MLPIVTHVIPQEDFLLTLTFQTGEKKTFDMKPYLDIGIYHELRDPGVFESVKVVFGTVEWSNGADIDPECLYEQGQVE